MRVWPMKQIITVSSLKYMHRNLSSHSIWDLLFQYFKRKQNKKQKNKNKKQNKKQKQKKNVIGVFD